jgi:hypothetical protein
MSDHRICNLLKILSSHDAMMCRWMMLAEVVGGVGLTGRPVEGELALADAALEPMVPHVEGFRTFETDCCMENTVGSGIVGFEGGPSSGLRMAHFFKGSANGNGVLGIEKEGPDFSFGGGCSNGAQSFTQNVDGSVGFR